jgi:hypothetical protein
VSHFTAESFSAKGSVMEQLQALSTARKLILGGAILLLIDTFLDWQHVSLSLGGEEVASGGQSAWHGFWGVVLGLMTIALIAWAIARMFGAQLPEGVPEGIVALVLGGLILLFAIIKVLVDDFVHWPAYVGIVLAAVVAFGAWRNFQESGESMPSLNRGARPAGPAPEPGELSRGPLVADPAPEQASLPPAETPPPAEPETQPPADAPR